MRRNQILGLLTTIVIGVVLLAGSRTMLAPANAIAIAHDEISVLEPRDDIPIDESLLVLPAEVVVAEDGSVFTHCAPCSPGCCPNGTHHVQLVDEDGENCIYNCTLLCIHDPCQ